MATRTESINLLPWRETMHEYRRRRLLVKLWLVVLVAAAIQGGLVSYFSGKITDKKQSIDQLNRRIALANEAANRQALRQQAQQTFSDRVAAMRSLNQRRNELTRLMTALAEMIPEGVYLEKAERQERVQLWGVSVSGALFDEMLTNMQQRAEVDALRVHAIRAVKSGSSNPALAPPAQQAGQGAQAFEISFQFSSANIAAQLPAEAVRHSTNIEHAFDEQ